MSKRLVIVFLLVVVTSMAVFTMYDQWGTWVTDRQVPPAEPRSGDDYLRGTHWFGDGWAVNLWNTRLLDAAREDFEAIRADGFNTVVIVVPWPGFAAGKRDGSLVPDRVARLEALMDLADDEGLDVVLRLGYAWDSSVRRPAEWFVEMWHEDDVLRSWLDYIEGLWTSVGDRDNLQFAFISWEDLWAITWVGTSTAPRRLEMARISGFREWLRDRMDLQEASTRYGTDFANWNEVPTPHSSRPEWALFLEFLDHAWVERFFRPAQARFPKLSMEIRIDGDPVYGDDGQLDHWHRHHAAWDLPEAPWTTIYWSPAMGGRNEGERLAPDTAAKRLRYVLEQVRAVTGDRPIFIDQFLVEDFTPGYENNGRVAPEDIPRLLELAAPVLKRYAQGYALWAWKDYLHDAVPSPDFSVSGTPWSYSPGVRETTAPGLSLAAGQGLERSFDLGEFHAPGGPEDADLCVVATSPNENDAELIVFAPQDERSPMRLPATGERECVIIDVDETTDLNLVASGNLEIEHMTFSGFVQPTGIRDLDGRRKPIADDWTSLNDQLDRTFTAPFALHDDGWMGKTLDSDLERATSADQNRLAIDTSLPADWPFEPQLTVRVNGNVLGRVTCRPGGRDVLDLPPGLQAATRLRVTLTADRTWQPKGDERRLACQVDRIALAPAEP